MDPLIGIVAMLAAIGVGFFLGTRRTPRPTTDQMERRLEEYDFYPFVAAELKEHDKDLYDLMVQIWGELK